MIKNLEHAYNICKGLGHCHLQDKCNREKVKRYADNLISGIYNTTELNAQQVRLLDVFLYHSVSCSEKNGCQMLLCKTFM